MIFIGVDCDKCRKTLSRRYISKTKVIEWARGKGWSVGKLTLCPDCRKLMRR